MIIEYLLNLSGFIGLFVFMDEHYKNEIIKIQFILMMQLGNISQF